MNIMKPYVTLLAIVCLMTPSFARIGETPKECIARYGEPTKINKMDHTILFQKKGFQILVYFWKEQVHQIIIAKAEKDVLGNAINTSDAEIQALLNANKNDSVWKKDAVFSMDKQWKRSDGKAIAQYSSTNKMLLIATNEYLEHKAAKKAEKETENLNDF